MEEIKVGNYIRLTRNQEMNLDEYVTDEDLYEFCKYKYGKTPQELLEEEK